LKAADDVAQALLDRASLQEPELRQDAATLAGWMERVFASDPEAASHYTQLTAFDLPHRLAVAAVRDSRLFSYAEGVLEAGFCVLEPNLVDQDIAGLADPTSRAIFRRYASQLEQEYVIRYIQPALRGEGKNLWPYAWMRVLDRTHPTDRQAR
jgi:hypothetical protein